MILFRHFIERKQRIWLLEWQVTFKQQQQTVSGSKFWFNDAQNVC